MKHLNKVLFFLIFLCTPAFATMYEDNDNTFLSPEYFFIHQPIEIKYNNMKATLLSMKQKDGVGFYLINGKKVDFVSGVRFVDKVESIFTYKKNNLVILSTRNIDDKKSKGKEYKITILDIIPDKNKITIFDDFKSNFDDYCFEGVYFDGVVSNCTLKDAESIKKHLDSMQPKQQ